MWDKLSLILVSLVTTACMTSKATSQTYKLDQYIFDEIIPVGAEAPQRFKLPEYLTAGEHAPLPDEFSLAFDIAARKKCHGDYSITYENDILYFHHIGYEREFQCTEESNT